MADDTKLAEAIAKKLYKTKAFYVHGDIKRKIDSDVNVFTDLNVKFKGIGDFSKGRLVDLSDEVLKLIEYKSLDVSEYTSTLMNNYSKNAEIFQNCKNVNDYILFDSKNRTVLDLDPRIILNRLSKDDRANTLVNMKLGALVFDAFNPDPIIPEMIDTLGVPKYLLNRYNPPRWQTEYPNPIEESHLERLPKLMQDALDFLIPSKKEQEIVLCWIANALVSRHQSFLHLRGCRGSGKTILAKLIGAIVSYCYEAKEGVNQDGFNADLRNKRIIIIDDDNFLGTQAGYMLRKKLTNPTITVNEKFVQTLNTEKQFASYIICSNPDDMFYVKCDERKMVQVTLAEKNINTVLSEGKLAFLDGLLKTDEADYTDIELRFLAHLGHYVLNLSKSKKFSATHNYLGGCFWSDVIKSLGAFKKHVVETLMSGSHNSYTYEDFIFAFNKVKTNRQTAVKFENIYVFLLNEFFYKGNLIVKSIDKSTKTFYPIDEYRSSFNAFDEDDDGGFDL